MLDVKGESREFPAKKGGFLDDLQLICALAEKSTFYHYKI
jgi:hypothetical protein